MAAAAAGAGVLGAILGLGGGILLVPILTMFFGVSLPYAMGASIISVIATSCGAAAGHLRSGLANIRLGLFLAADTVAGALIGASLVGVVPERVLELLFGLALAYSAFTTVRQLHVEVPAPAVADPLALRFALSGSYYDQLLARDVEYCATRVRRGAVAMFAAGVLSGLLGIGSGAFKVLAMDHFMRLPMKVSTATSNFMIGITAAASAGVYFGRGDIHPIIATPVAVGVLLGSYGGTRLIVSLRNTTVRKLFLPVVLYLALSMLLRGLGVWH
ncbi:MAG TPA: sulfite exporter TauE/SafE family protein [Methylomirabilota bacterium]|nr:sulfite exporter TauE/SafE family protein [Methylomirabilota bacterium]